MGRILVGERRGWQGLTCRGAVLLRLGHRHKPQGGGNERDRDRFHQGLPSQDAVFCGEIGRKIDHQIYNDHLNQGMLELAEFSICIHPGTLSRTVLFSWITNPKAIA